MDIGLPWLPSPIEPRFRKIFYNFGERLCFSKNSVLMSEDSKHSYSFLIKSGMLGTSLVDYLWQQEEILCIICLPGTVSSDCSLAVGAPNPVKITALQRSEVYCIKNDELSKHLATNGKECETAFQIYTSKCFKRGADSLVVLNSFQAEERIKCLFASIAVFFEASLDSDYIKLPVKITRSTIYRATHISPSSLDRTFSRWAKVGALKRDEGFYLIETRMLLEYIEWMHKF
jgi:hypothetical protein